jgi:hypothetical protein
MRKIEFAVLSVCLICSSPAFAGLSIGLNIGIPAPVVVAPAPVVVEQPAPVVVEPAPVVVAPAPVVVAPAPVVVAPPPIVMNPMVPGPQALCPAVSFSTGGAALYAASCMDPLAYSDAATLQLLAGCRFVGPDGLAYYTQGCVNGLHFDDGAFWVHAGFLRNHYAAHLPPPDRRPGFDPHDPGFDRGGGRGGPGRFKSSMLDDVNDQLAQMNGAILDPSAREQADQQGKNAAASDSSSPAIQTASAGQAI